MVADRMEQGGASRAEQDRAVQEKLVVRIADRPDLLPIVAGWLWHGWWHQDGYTLEQTHDAVAASVSPSGPPQSFVLMIDGKPIGTASLVVHDLDEGRSDPLARGCVRHSRGPWPGACRPPDPGCRSALPVCRHPWGVALHGRRRARVRACWMAQRGNYPTSWQAPGHTHAS